MAVAFAAAIFARDDMLRYAMSVIVLSWFLSRFWRMAFGPEGFGFLVIDVFLAGVFLQRWLYGLRYNRIFAKHLAIIHAMFIVLHFLAATIDLSAQDFFGAERDHDWMYGFWRNRIFEASLLYIISVSAARIAVRNAILRRIIIRALLAARGLKCDAGHGEKQFNGKTVA